MTGEAGGLRDRLIIEGVFRTIGDGLAALGWFDNQEPTILDAEGAPIPNPHFQGSTTRRAHQPLNYVGKPVNPRVQIPPNTVSVFGEAYDDEEVELGSSRTEDRHAMSVDIFGQSDAVSRELSGDIRDILKGKLPSIGRDRPFIGILDYTLATPSLLFYVELEKVRIDQAHHFEEHWLQFWRTVSFDVVVETD